MDVAASEFCKEGPKYDLDFKNPDSDPNDWLEPKQLADLYLVRIWQVFRCVHPSLQSFSRSIGHVFFVHNGIVNSLADYDLPLGWDDF